MKLIFTILLSTLMITVAVFSRSGWVSQIPNGSKNSCANCHPSGNYGQTNKFGQAVKFYVSGGKVNWGEALALLDSDGDGFTNGVELQDPEGTWSQGNPAPGDLSLVTNPGDANSFPNENYVEDFSKISGLTVNGIYPNPINENSNLSLPFANEGNLKIVLFDYSGLYIGNLYEGKCYSGEFNLNLGYQSNQYSGQYFLKITFNEYSVFEKILIIK